MTAVLQSSSALANIGTNIGTNECRATTQALAHGQQKNVAAGQVFFTASRKFVLQAQVTFFWF